MDVFWTMLTFFLGVIWISILIIELIDVFRRRDISGWGKAAWTLFLVVLPYLGVFVYLVTQSKGMAERKSAELRADKARFDQLKRRAPA